MHDYPPSRGVEPCFIPAPADAPSWAQDRAALWNAAEARETRAQRYREGKRSISGTTAFPPANERPVSVLSASAPEIAIEAAATCEPLLPARIDDCLGERA